MADVDVRNRAFVLQENHGGHVTGDTVIAFSPESDPWRGIYQGPNVVHGQVLLAQVDRRLRMLYHAYTTDGELRAGQAAVFLTELSEAQLQMRLEWQWLTGDRSSGESLWIANKEQP